MARIYYTVDDLVAEVRSQLDETNTDTISTTADILPALNRAQEYAFDLYSRKYPEPIMAYSTLTLTSGTTEYDIPEGVYEDRLLKVEIILTSSSGGTYVDIPRVSYVDMSELEPGVLTSVPSYYTIYGRTIRFLGTPSGTYNARIWYLTEISRLVAPQGRITSIDTGTPAVTVDAIGSGVSTTSDNLASYLNIIDGQTGKIKGSVQVSSTSGTTITLRSSPLRSSVLNKTVAGSLPSTAAIDDYVCLIQGTCVPQFGAPTSNFLVQFAVAELTRKLGGESTPEVQLLEKLEKQLESVKVARNFTSRIHNRSRIWSRAIRGRFYPRSLT